MSERSRIIRELFAKSDAERDKGLTTPADVERFDNIAYGSDPEWQLLDVYRPRGAKGKLPVVVSVHGGGWVYGSKEVYQFYLMDIAKRGFAAVNFSYRLAPENRFPASLEDTNTVLGWVKANAEKYGFDLDNVFAVGDSAGAFGLAVTSCIMTNAALAERFGRFFTPADIKLKGVALNCGLYTAKGKEKDLEDYLPTDPAERAEALELLDAVSHVTPDFPPCFVMTSTGDFLLNDRHILLEALEAKGVKHVCRVYGDGKNKPGHVFHCDIKTGDAAVANDDECAFFKELMHSRTSAEVRK